MNFFQRQAVAFRNEMRSSSAALLGIAQGVLSDSELQDREIVFLRDWLRNNQSIAAAWPGNVIAAQIERCLADGVISHDERAHLVGVLQRLVGGTLDELAESAHVTELAIDEVQSVSFDGRRFCLTGDFCFGTRPQCEQQIVGRGGLVLASVTKKLDYLIVGGLGSPEWKFGSFGTKVEKAMQYKTAGAPIKVVHEDAFAAALMER